MLRLIDLSGEAHPIVGYEDLCWIHKQSGYDTLSFDIPIESDDYKLILPESKIEYRTNIWKIKKISDGTVQCDIDFGFLKRKVYKAYESATRSLSAVLVEHLPDDWTVVGAESIVIKRTIKFDYCTDYDVINACLSTYKVYFVWNTVDKILSVVDSQNIPESDEYLTTDLNLKRISYQGSTKDFVTRLFCYGKDGMTFSDINDGKEYIENFYYSSEIICGTWDDERYTIKESLLEDGKELLAKLSAPVDSYECEAVNLAKLNDIYSFLEFKLHIKILLVDKNTDTRISHVVAEYKEYPEEPIRDVLVLSTVADSISSQINDLSSATNDEDEKIVVEVSSLVEAVSDSIAEQTDNVIEAIDAEFECVALSAESKKKSGYNLILNSSGVNGLNCWTAVGDVSVVDDNGSLSGHCFMIGANASISQQVKVPAARDYTLSFHFIKYHTGSASIRVAGEDGTITSYEVPSMQEEKVNIHIINVDSEYVLITIVSDADFLFVSDIVLCEGVMQETYWSPSISDESAVADNTECNLISAPFDVYGNDSKATVKPTETGGFSVYVI